MVIVTLNHTLTSIFGNVKKNASGRTNNVMENAMVEEDSRVETTCASAVKMIPSVAGLQANKTKYFRLRLTDEVSSERPMRVLRP